MAKRNVKVKLERTNPSKMAVQNDRIISKHEELGENSPIRNIDMDTYKADNQKIKDHLKSWADYREKAEIEREKAARLLGIDKGQSINTPGTTYNTTAHIRDILLAYYKGTEEELSNWGFDVVVK
jgi:hypothetical protein